MAGLSSPTFPVRYPSARLQTSKFGKQRRDCFHSLPSVGPAQWRSSQERLPDAEDGSTGSANTKPRQHRNALSSGSDSGKLHDLELRHPRSQRQTVNGERKLVRLPLSWPLRSTAEAMAKTFSSPSGASSGEPLGPGHSAAVGARRTADTVRQPEAQSTVVKTSEPGGIPSSCATGDLYTHHHHSRGGTKPEHFATIARKKRGVEAEDDVRRSFRVTKRARETRRCSLDRQRSHPLAYTCRGRAQPAEDLA
ncbi:hypothetical protein HPB51_019077 [Rhipicephalus microplus]|uniref:Uncharacterized protein n=1 Tax=Rhipicephalus microplus TaxID=6941 RepID=A0A9J6D6U5_RHIMP|nr:hypothetical protein HPB51_019077 [Rhipicephalus microplus]